MRWIIKRIIRSVLTIYFVLTLSFVIVRLMPGGPMDYVRAQALSQGSSMTTDQLNSIIQTYVSVNPGRPLHEQYVEYLFAITQGDLGRSLYHDQPVNAILAEALPWTVLLIGTSLFLIYFIGIMMGAIMAYFEGTDLDLGLTAFATILNSIPNYIFAVLIIYVFGFDLGWLPTQGRVDSALASGLTPEYLSSVVLHAVLPISALVISGFGNRALSMRGNSISILGEDFLRVARLRGLPERRIAMRYVARNAVLPMYTGLITSIGFMFGSSVIIEEIFGYRGLGYYLFQGVSTRDQPLMMGCFIVITLAVVGGIMIADMTYGIIDPRAAEEGK